MITRQRPGSASGVIFVTMEDETGYVNLIVWNRVAVEQRAALLESRLLEVHGKLQREGDVQHVIARQLTNLSVACSAISWWRREISIELVLFTSFLHVQPDGAHQLDAVALGDDAGPQLEIELELAVHQFVLEMHVHDAPGVKSGNIGQGQIVRADQADRAALDQGANESLRADAPIRRIGTLQQFVQQKQQRQRAGLEQLAQSGDLGIKARAALMQRIVDADAGADLQRCELQRAARTGAPAIASTVLMPMVRNRVLLPDMFEPLTSNTRVVPSMRNIIANAHRGAGSTDGPAASP